MGGAYGEGSRIKLKYTRAIIDAIHSGELSAAETTSLPLFGLQVPTHVTGVPDDILQPRQAWPDKAAYDAQLEHLADLYCANMKDFEGQTAHVSAAVQHAIMSAGPTHGAAATSEGDASERETQDDEEDDQSDGGDAHAQGLTTLRSRCGEEMGSSLNHVPSSSHIRA